MRIAVYAMLGLLGQSLMAGYFGCALFAGISAPMLSVMVQYAVPYFVDSLSLGSSVCLLLTRCVGRQTNTKIFACF